MPELPEVETVRRGLLPVWEGRRLTRVTCHRADLRQPFPEGMAQTLTGRTIERLDRRAKYLLVHLSGGVVLIVHLGMSGRMSIAPGADGPVGKHDHVVFVTDRDMRVTFTDPRRFGLMDVVAADALNHHPLLVHLGPEPLGTDFTAAHLQAELAKRRSPIKTILLDQSVVAGLGNIYVCESLYRAGLHPATLGQDVTAAKVKRLVGHVRDVLNEAIAAGGTTLRDHQRPDGELGYFQHQFAVYGRENQPCSCGGTIRRLTQAGRSTFFCPSCQK